MAYPDYFITLEQHTDATLADFSAMLMKCPKKPVGTVQLSELCSMTDYPHGVYLFFDDMNVLWYVGKATSRSFIERVPSHFDQRPAAWLNTLPKRIKEVCNIEKYADALTVALSLRLVLIGVQDKKTALKLESVLRAYLKPKLNTAKKPYTGQELLSSFVATD